MPAGSTGDVEAIAERVWTRIAGAHRHEVEEIRTPGGAVRYVAAHHQKESQAPPESWGPVRRVRPSRGYWSLPAKDLRKLAAEKPRDARLAFNLMRQLDGLGVPEDVFDEVWDAARERYTPPEVVRVREFRGRMVQVLTA